MERCISPRPATLNASVESVSVTLRETSFRVSFKRRSRRFREVTYFPSRPAKGESFTTKVISMVGAEIWTKGRGFGSVGITDRIPDGDIADAGDCDDIAGVGFCDSFLCQTVVFVDIGRSQFFAGVVIMVIADDDVLILGEFALFDSPHRNPADEFVVVQCGDQHLKRLIVIGLWSGM